MNLAAVYTCVPGLLIGGVVFSLTRSEVAALFTCGPILVVADLVMRLRSRGDGPLHSLFGRGAGGILFVFPVWILGVIQVGGAVAKLSGWMR